VRALVESGLAQFWKMSRSHLLRVETDSNRCVQSGESSNALPWQLGFSLASLLSFLDEQLMLVLKQALAPIEPR
jgi:hypothetical protein